MILVLVRFALYIVGHRDLVERLAHHLVARVVTVHELVGIEVVFGNVRVLPPRKKVPDFPAPFAPRRATIPP